MEIVLDQDVELAPSTKTKTTLNFGVTMTLPSADSRVSALMRMVLTAARSRIACRRLVVATASRSGAG